MILKNNLNKSKGICLHFYRPIVRLIMRGCIVVRHPSSCQRLVLWISNVLIMFPHC